MSNEAETVKPLELLARTCERRGWALCLVSTADRYQGAKRLPSGKIAGRLDALVVVNPSRGQGASRTANLLSGRVLARLPLQPCRADIVAGRGETTVEAAAGTILEALGRCGLLNAA